MAKNNKVEYNIFSTNWKIEKSGPFHLLWPIFSVYLTIDSLHFAFYSVFGHFLFFSTKNRPFMLLGLFIFGLTLHSASCVKTQLSANIFFGLLKFWPNVFSLLLLHHCKIFIQTYGAKLLNVWLTIGFPLIGKEYASRTWECVPTKEVLWEQNTS